MKYLVIALAIAATACNTNKDLARRCAEAYPCQDSLIIQDTTIHDTIAIGPLWATVQDTVVCPPSDTVTISSAPRQVLIPVTRVAIEYQVRDTCYIRTDAANEAALQNEIATLRDQLETAEQRLASARPYKYITWGLLALLVALLAYVITKALKNKRA